MFVKGLGGAGFDLPGPAVTRGRGASVLGNPRPALARGPPVLIPWTGPCLLLQTFNWSVFGVGLGQRQVQAMPK